jgi:hypothetical protein
MTGGLRSEAGALGAVPTALPDRTGPPTPDQVRPLLPVDTGLSAQGAVGVETAHNAPFLRTTAASPAHAAPVLQQLVAAVRSSGAATTEIRLEPVELGRVTLTLSSGETGIVVVVAADRPETVDLIRRNLDSLSAELRQIGYGSVSYSFTDSGSGAGHGRAATLRNREAVDASAEDGATDGPRRPPRIAGDGMLDIRM